MKFVISFVLLFASAKDLRDNFKGRAKFNGQDSWAYVNVSRIPCPLYYASRWNYKMTVEEDSRDLINRQTGTIMIQLELGAPVPDNGLVFFVGNPEQSNYFFAFHISEGEPKVTYRLMEGNRISTISLDKALKFNETEGSYNIRIGIVGGIAGLAVQEWRENKVQSAENFFITAKSARCRHCEFRIANEIYFGGFRPELDTRAIDHVLKKSSAPYSGEIGRVKINHTPFNFQTALSNAIRK